MYAIGSSPFNLGYIELNWSNGFDIIEEESKSAITHIIESAVVDLCVPQNKATLYNTQEEAVKILQTLKKLRFAVKVKNSVFADIKPSVDALRVYKLNAELVDLDCRDNYDMSLTFSGVGAGFSNKEIGHTSAYFEQNDGKDLYMIDCPMSAFYHYRENGLFAKYENYYCIITHTHPDHISGLALTAQHLYFVNGTKLNIIVPTMEVWKDIETLMNIEGNQRLYYYMETVATFKNSNVNKCLMTEVATSHAPELEGKCFGYVFSMNGKIVVYSGDTSTLKPFESFIVNNTEVYVDTSVHYGQIHLKLDEILDNKILKHKGVTTYLMHLDDFEDAVKMVKDAKREDIKIVIKGKKCV